MPCSTYRKGIHMSDLLSIYKELQAKKWVDLSHQINAESPHFPALPALQQEDLSH